MTSPFSFLRFIFSYVFQANSEDKESEESVDKLSSRKVDPFIGNNKEVYFWVNRLRDNTMELQIELQIWHWFRNSIIGCSSGLELKGLLKELDCKLLFHDLRPLRIGIHSSAIGGCHCLYVTKAGFSYYCFDVVGEATPFAKAQLQLLQLVKNELI